MRRIVLGLALVSLSVGGCEGGGSGGGGSGGGGSGGGGSAASSADAGDFDASDFDASDFDASDFDASDFDAGAIDAGAIDAGDSEADAATDAMVDSGQQPVCGDGALGAGEGCDDGNASAGDGCSASCAVESGFTCAGEPAVCNAICGDGIVAGAEACDDGGTANSDGCSGTCVRENGYACAGSPSVCATSCGDGVVAGAEQCDDQGASGGGCSNTCSVETGYGCTGSPSVCSAVCGDGKRVGGEACDDGNTLSGDCCSSTCTQETSAGALTCETEPNDACAEANGPIADGGGLAASSSTVADADIFEITLLATSDLRIETFDGISNTTCSGIDTRLRFYDSAGTELVSDDDDGLDSCSLLNPTLDTAMRRVVAGTYYVGVEELDNAAPITKYNARFNVLSTCGDAVIASSEECDDDGTADGDGCSVNCVVEPSYRCSGVPSTCVEIEQACSDGIDNNANGLTDNADPDCVLAAYFPGCGALETLSYYAAPSLPAAIPDSDLNGVSRTITTTGSGTIARAALLLSIAHSYDADLDVTLVSPSALSLNVTSDNGGSGDNYLSSVFDSTCAVSVTAGAAPFSGCYRPEMAFDGLVGSSAAGTWTVRVADDGAGDTGMLTSAWLVLCVTP